MQVFIYYEVTGYKMTIDKINPIAKTTISINLRTSNVNDKAHVLAAARNLRHSSCYHRYGSTIEFYIPNMYADRFINTAEGDGLDVII